MNDGWRARALITTFVYRKIGASEFRDECLFSPSSSPFIAPLCLYLSICMCECVCVCVFGIITDGPWRAFRVYSTRNSVCCSIADQCCCWWFCCCCTSSNQQSTLPTPLFACPLATQYHTTLPIMGFFLCLPPFFLFFPRAGRDRPSVIPVDWMFIFITIKFDFLTNFFRFLFVLDDVAGAQLGSRSTRQTVGRPNRV